MNKKQRIVLVIGAVAFLYVIFTTPKISIIKGTYVTPSPDKKDVAKIVDVRTAMTKAVAVLGATLLIFIALKDRKMSQQSPTERLPVIGGCRGREGQPVERGVAAKILKFLKDFF